MRGHGARHSGARVFSLSGILRIGCTGLLLLAVSVMPFGIDVTPASALDPVTYWVDGATGSDTNPGTEAQPFKSLAKACSMAQPSDTIMVRPGTYTTDEGGGAGLTLNGASLVSTHGAASTTITQSGSGRLIWGQSFVGGDVIRGFTFTGGTGGSPGGVGGAIRVQFNVQTGPSPLTIEDNVFVGNSSGGYAGGALAFYNTSVDPGEHHLLVRNNLFENNACTPNDGGAVYIYGAVDTRIEANTFIGNTAGYGGALKCNTKDKEVVVTDNTFFNNEATTNGGAIDLVHQGHGGFEVHRNEIRTNMTGAFGGGGGIHSFGGILNLSGNLIADNGANQGGAVCLEGASSVSAWNNLIDDCYSNSGFGQAWYLGGTSALWEAYDTVAGNGGAGGPVVTYAEPSASLTIVNSVYRNTFGNPTEVRNADAISYSYFADADLFEAANGNTVGDAVTIGDPLLVGGGDRRLSADSPCIDAADPSVSVDRDFYGTARPRDGDGDYVPAPDMGYHEYAMPQLAIEGGSRFTTAVAASNAAYPAGLDPSGARTVVIATGRNWPDALGGTALAGALDGPVLLVDTTSIPSAVMDEIRRLKTDKAIILGGTGVLSTAVENALEAELGPGDVERLWGATRYETANAVAARVRSVLGAAWDGHVFIATGGNFPDALAAAPLAASKGWPLYLAHPATGLSAATKSALTGASDAVVLGGTGAVNAGTETYLKGRLGDSHVRRLWGPDRYKTAVAVSQYAVSEQGHTWDWVGVATGRDFPDALAGGVLQGKAGSVMLLTQPTSLNPDTQQVLEDNSDEILTVTFFGGSGAVSPAVRAAALMAAD